MICKKGSGMISAKSGSMSSLQKHLAINFTKALSSKHHIKTSTLFAFALLSHGHGLVHIYSHR